MATLARKLSLGHPFLYGGTLLVAIVVGAAIAYAQGFLGDSGSYVVVGSILVAVVVVAILLEWRLGVLMLPAVLPYESVIKIETSSGGLASGVKALALLTFFSLALGLLTERKLSERLLRLWQQPLTLAVFTLALWALASMLWASHQDAAQTKATTFLGVFGLMMVVGMLEKRYLGLLWAVAALSAAISIPAAYVLPENDKMITQGRFSSGGADPNDYACLLVIVLVVAYFGLRHYRIATYLASPVLLFGIFASQSRTALIALAATPVLAMFVPRLTARLGGRTLIMYGLGAVVLAGVVLALPLVGETVEGRYMTLSQYEDEATWAGRWSIWQGVLEVIASHPILGVGAGNFKYSALELSAQLAEKSAQKGDFWGAAHNMFLSVASELGFVGLVLFLGILFFAFRMVLPISKRSTLGTGIFLGLIAFTIAGLTLTWEYQKIGYVLFGSILSLHLQQVEQRVPLPDEQETLR